MPEDIREIDIGGGIKLALKKNAVGLPDSEVWQNNKGFVCQGGSKFDTACLVYALANASFCAGNRLPDTVFQAMVQEAHRINGMTYATLSEMLRAAESPIEVVSPSAEWVTQIYIFDGDPIEPVQTLHSQENPRVDTGMTRLQSERYLKDQMDSGKMLLAAIDVNYQIKLCRNII